VCDKDVCYLLQVTGFESVQATNVKQECSLFPNDSDEEGRVFKRAIYEPVNECWLHGFIISEYILM
jgi:hypothetical protein